MAASAVPELDADMGPKKPTQGELLRRACKYQSRAGPEGRACAAAQRAARQQAAAAAKAKRPRHRIDLSEQSVLKRGIRVLHEKLAGLKAAELLDMPRKQDGSCKLMRQSFFERLLSSEIHVQGSMPSDMAAAQSDLRHLTLEQLLVLRSRTLDFATESRSHDAHNSFLATLDRHLFERMAVQHFRGKPPQDAHFLGRLGFQLAVVVGAAAVLEDGPGDGEATTRVLPMCWALPLDCDDEARRVAVFNRETIEVDLLPLEHQEVAAVAAGCNLAVVWDRSSGTGKDRVLHWEVTVVSAEDEELGVELARAQKGQVKVGGSTARTLRRELDVVLARRDSAPGVLAQTLDSPSSSVSTAASLGSVHRGLRPAHRKSAPSALARCATAFGVVGLESQRPNERSDKAAPADENQTIQEAETAAGSATGATRALRAEINSGVSSFSAKVAECSSESAVAAAAGEAEAAAAAAAPDKAKTEPDATVERKDNAKGPPQQASTPEGEEKAEGPQQPASTHVAKPEAHGPVVFDMAIDDSDDECAWSAPRSPQPVSPREPTSPWEVDSSTWASIVPDAAKVVDKAAEMATGWEDESFIGEDHTAATDLADFLGGPATDDLSTVTLAAPSQGSAAARGSRSPHMPTLRALPLARRGSGQSAIWLRLIPQQPVLAVCSGEGGGVPLERPLETVAVGMPPLRSAASMASLGTTVNHTQHRRRARASLAALPPPPITELNPAARRASAPALLGLLSLEPGEEAAATASAVKKDPPPSIRVVVTSPSSPIPDSTRASNIPSSSGSPLGARAGQSPQSPPESSTNDRSVSACSSGATPHTPLARPPWARRSSTPASASATSPIAGVGAFLILR